jgi:ubiquinone/menaquinone biosynthesis C-methylase UbiE
MIWDKIASRYDRIFESYKELREATVKQVLTHIEGGDKVLELACGTGNVSLAIAKKVDNLVATDLSKGMISVAKQKAKKLNVDNIDFKILDALDTKYPNESFDKIVLISALHVVNNPRALLDEAYRLLAPQGSIITTSECYAEPVKWQNRVGFNFLKLLYILKIIPKFYFFYMKDIDNLLKDSGFNVETKEILNRDPVNYFTVATK